MTPTPPGSACAWRAGVGFTMSKSRNSRKARASTGGVNGSRSTASVIPATSSMTIAPGSLAPSARSACWAAHVPITATATKNTTSPARENGTIQSTTAVSALATVPGATGAQPTPPTVARATATRVVVERVRLGALADELVAFHLGDAHAREAPSREGGAVAEMADDVEHAPRADRAPHGAQHAVVAVLHRHVHVGHDARARELVERAVVDVRGMQVHRPDPGHPRVLAERQQQVADVAVAGEVTAVRERVLRDEDGLLDAARGEALDLRDDVAQRAAAVTTADLGDRAEGTAHVAALGDLHVGVRHLARQQPRGGGVVEIARRG